MNYESRIVATADVLHGKPRIKGTRIMVEQVLDLLSTGLSPESIQKEYFPDLTREDILACLRYARDLVRNEEIHILAEP